MNNQDNTTKLIQLFQQAKTEEQKKSICKCLGQILCLKKHERLRDIYSNKRDKTVL